MPALTAQQRAHLRKLAHPLKPVVQIGKQGLSDAVKTSVAQVLNTHELIKVKFGDFKEEKQTLARDLADATHSELVALIGNTAIFYRPHPQKEKRKIEFP